MRLRRAGARERAGGPTPIGLIESVYDRASFGSNRPLMHGLFDAGGVADISRWLSAAKHRYNDTHGLDPERVVETVATLLLRPLPGSASIIDASGGRAGARPPANSFDASGVGESRQRRRRRRY